MPERQMVSADELLEHCEISSCGRRFTLYMSVGDREFRRIRKNARRPTYRYTVAAWCEEDGGITFKLTESHKRSAHEKMVATIYEITRTLNNTRPSSLAPKPQRRQKVKPHKPRHRKPGVVLTS